MSKIVEPYDKPGYKPPVRCHRCGTRKNDEDIGVYLQFEVEGKELPNVTHKVWFHNKEDRDMWIENNKARIVRIIELDND